MASSVAGSFAGGLAEARVSWPETAPLARPTQSSLRSLQQAHEDRHTDCPLMRLILQVRGHLCIKLTLDHEAMGCICCGAGGALPRSDSRARSLGLP